MLAFLLIFSFFLANLSNSAVLAAPSVSAESAIILDADNGTVLFEKNADKEMLIASTTKIMTALIVLENCDIDDDVEIKSEYTSVEGSSMYLKAGETYTIRELLFGLMLASGNDAAVALACHTAGSIDEFAKLMNEKASELGCTGSSFKNPHGLDADGHYSTARDLAKITSAAMKFNQFCEIVSTKNITINGKTYTNHNKLLWNLDGALGVKTGYTQSAGRSLVSCVEQDGMKLICVTLSDPDDWQDHEIMYSWAFSQFSRVTISKSDTKYGFLSVISGVKDSAAICPESNYSITISNDDSLEVLTELPRFVYAAVTEGEHAGNLVLRLNGEEIAEIPLVFYESVDLDENIPLTRWEKVKWLWYFVNKYSINRFGYYGY